MDHMRNQALVIQWLLRHPPAERPTSLELSRSNLLPPQMEDAYLEEVARTIANPNTPYYEKLMRALFAQEFDRHKDYTYDYTLHRGRLQEPGLMSIDGWSDLVSGTSKGGGTLASLSSSIAPEGGRDTRWGEGRELGHVRKILERCFRRHGAISLDTSLFLPKSAFYAGKPVVEFMDATGAIVQVGWIRNTP